MLSFFTTLELKHLKVVSGSAKNRLYNNKVIALIPIPPLLRSKEDFFQ